MNERLKAALEVTHRILTLVSAASIPVMLFVASLVAARFETLENRIEQNRVSTSANAAAVAVNKADIVSLKVNAEGNARSILRELDTVQASLRRIEEKVDRTNP